MGDALWLWVMAMPYALDYLTGATDKGQLIAALRLPLTRTVRRAAVPHFSAITPPPFTHMVHFPESPSIFFVS